MYEFYWELTEKPFKNSMSPRFFYFSSEHEEALVRMLFTVTDSKGMMFLTGESGVGKTYVSRLFAAEMKEKGFQVGIIVNPMLEATQLLQEILYAFGIYESYSEKVDLWQRLKQHLTTLAETGGHAILIIDEAQLIADRDTFEEIRLLLNLESDERPLMNIFLTGESELWSRVRTMPQLLQRIGVAYQLNPFTEENTKLYIRHRMEVSGAKREIFTDEACTQVFHHSRGVAREINTICDMALLVAGGNEKKQVDKEAIADCIRELQGGSDDHQILDQFMAKE